MKENFTEIVFILDESGSMYDLRDDTIGGYNSMLEKQRELGGNRAYVSTVLFSNKSKVIHDRVEIDKAPSLTKAQYQPDGCTALLDAVGDAIKHIKNVHKYAREEDRPEKTLFIITTDGMENASKFYGYEKIKKLISEQKEKFGWEFLFLAANIDAKEVAGNMGLSEEQAINYNYSKKGTQNLYKAASLAVDQMLQERVMNWERIEECVMLDIDDENK